MSHWLDETARGLAEGRYSRRQVVRRGGAALAGGLLFSAAGPLRALGMTARTTRCGVHTCPDGHACCDDEYCYDPATHKCCGKGNICARGDSCCGNHCCSAGEQEHCCGGEVCCRSGRACCGVPGSVENPVGCCEAGEHCCHSEYRGGVVFNCCKENKTCCGEKCCDKTTEECCNGLCYDPVERQCCGDELCLKPEECCAGKCCHFPLICCGGHCCHRANCHNGVCKPSPPPQPGSGTTGSNERCGRSSPSCASLGFPDRVCCPSEANRGAGHQASYCLDPDTATGGLCCAADGVAIVCNGKCCPSTHCTGCSSQTGCIC